jgi:hypothetical protein
MGQEIATMTDDLTFPAASGNDIQWVFVAGRMFEKKNGKFVEVTEDEWSSHYRRPDGTVVALEWRRRTTKP